MRLLVIGAAGFIGSRLVCKLAQTYPSADIIASDLRAPAIWQDVEVMPNVKFLEGDIRDPRLIEALFRHPVDTVFHLAAALTMDAEASFDRGMEINLQSLIRVLEACRLQATPPKFIFASSISTFGGDLPPVVDDFVHQNPQTSYGTHKVIGEHLVNDYSRRGFLDGRSLRLPIVLTHPGPPSSSVSDRIASLIREPLGGQPVVCPINPDTSLAVISIDRVLAAMLKLHGTPSEVFIHTRTMNLPALTVTPREIVDAVVRRLPPNTPNRVEWKLDPVLQKVVESWPGHFISRQATALELMPDSSVDEVVNNYLSAATLDQQGRRHPGKATFEEDVKETIR